jgi:hypothetical protein
VARQKEKSRLQKQIQRELNREARVAKKNRKEGCRGGEEEERAAARRAMAAAEHVNKARKRKETAAASKKRAGPLRPKDAAPNRVSKPHKKAKSPASKRVSSTANATVPPFGNNVLRL